MDGVNTSPGWPGWNTVRLIGHGSFGAVYEIERTVFDDRERCALKHISIPQSDGEIRDMRGEGMDNASITQNFADRARDIVAEYRLMTELNNCPNVVTCYDVQAVQKDSGYGWDIYIRMELLTPLMDELSRRGDLPEEDVLRLGIDIGRALAACQERSILHRDVKPQNIFIDKDGLYKLGDFGVARIREGTGSATIRTGTIPYMAPEVYTGGHYGASADVYSLGMVLYWLLNERRAPFMPLPPAQPTNAERDNAVKRRLGGEALPAPAHGSDEFRHIVLKACAYDPNNRYRSAEEMLRDLEALSSPAAAAQQVRETGKDPDATVRVINPPAPALQGQPEGLPGGGGTKNDAVRPAPETQDPPKKKPWIIATLVILAVAVGLMIFVFRKKPAETTPREETAAEVVPAVTTTPASESASDPTPAPEPTPTPTPTSDPTPSPSPTPTPTSAPTPTPIPVPNLRGYNIGDTFTFGQYEQDNNPDNGPEPIEWVVLTRNGDRILALSKKALMGRKFNKNVNSTWENCSLRTWLNDEFLHNAFNPAELAMIPTVTVSAEKNTKQPQTPAGNATKDKVFLLSMNEGTKYLSGKPYLKCYPTKYAIANGCNKDDKTGECWWWFRTPGINTKRAVFYSVNSRKIYDRGYGVHQKGGAVRPAIWIDLSVTPVITPVPEKSGISWEVKNGILTLGSAGTMENNYTYAADSETADSPWAGISNDITEAVIREGVTSVEDCAFQYLDSLSKVTIPTSVTYIGEKAFYGTGLTTVTIPASVVHIGIDAFADCASLQSINVDPNNMYYSSIDGVLFDKNKTNLIQAPCALSGTYEVPEGVVVLGCNVGDASLDMHLLYNSSGFCNSSISALILPSSVKIVNDCCFWGCELKDVYYAGNLADRKLIKISVMENWPLEEANWHYDPSASGQKGRVLGVVDMDYVLLHSKNDAARDQYMKNLCQKLGLNLDDYSRYAYRSTEFMWASLPLSKELITEEGCTTIIINDYYDTDEPYKAADELAQEYPDVTVIIAKDPNYTPPYRQ